MSLRTVHAMFQQMRNMTEVRLFSVEELCQLPKLRVPAADTNVLGSGNTGFKALDI